MTRRPRTSSADELREIEPARLSIHGVSKTFRGQRGDVEALEDIDLEVAEGEFVCLLGPSGCGKSTLLMLVAGLERPDRGEVRTQGELVAGPGRERMVMFQEHALFPWRTVLGNVMFGLELKPNLSNKSRREVAEYYLHLVGLQDVLHASVHELSGGMRQRVALARALAPNPTVLLMDEPFAALDAMTRERLYGDLQEICRKRRKTVLFVTHNVREASVLGDRVVVMTPQPGRIHTEFRVELPRPRDINGVAVAGMAGKITAALRVNDTPKGQS